MNTLNNYQRYIQFLIPNAIDAIGGEKDKFGKYTVKPLV